MPMTTRESVTTQPRPFPPPFERAVGVAGRPVSWLWTRGFGRDGVVPSCVKFRTRVPDAESDGLARLASKDDQPPGLTGLAQVHGRYGTAAEYKLGYDLQYLVNWPIVINIQILFRTVWVVVSRRV
jgi:lipopolysaccharide/colanic/teichoic acid biosynthesis glycosyltransferase